MAAVRANTEYQKEGVEYCVTRRDMILMFRVTTFLSILVVRRLFPFFKIQKYLLLYKEDESDLYLQTGRVRESLSTSPRSLF